MYIIHTATLTAFVDILWAQMFYILITIAEIWFQMSHEQTARIVFRNGLASNGCMSEGRFIWCIYMS